MLPLPPAPVPQQRVGDSGNGTRFSFTHTPPTYFIYSLYCKTPGFAGQTTATLQHDRMQAPSFPAMETQPRPAAPTSAYRRHAPSLRETTTTTASTEKFSGQPVPVPPVGWDRCPEPPGTD